MKKVVKLNQNREFTKLYKRGKSLVSPVIVTYVFKNHKKQTRIGITATKKIGGAVVRNRCKRVIRAAYNELPQFHNCGYDIVFVARVRTSKVKMQQVKQDMQQQLQKLVVAQPSN